MDGMSYTIGAGSILVTHIGKLDGTQQLLTMTYHLSQVLKYYGNILLVYMDYDNGDSFGVINDADKAQTVVTISKLHAMGNIHVGVGYAHQELAVGTMLKQLQQLTSAAAGNVREDTYYDWYWL